MACHWLGGRRLWVSHWLSHRIFAPESLDSPFSLGLPSLVPTLSILTPYSCTILFYSIFTLSDLNSVPEMESHAKACEPSWKQVTADTSLSIVSSLVSL